VNAVDQETAGQRIARARRRRGLSQAVLAGLVGRSESWLSQVERGRRSVDSHTVLTRLADVLRIDVEELAAGDRQTEGHVYEAAPAIEQAMMRPGVYCAGDPPVVLAHLRAAARAAYRDYQATRYNAAGRAVPGLIRDAEAAGYEDPAACRVRALVYDTAAALLNRTGEKALAWTAADRAVSAAAQSGDPLVTAASAWRMSYAITGRGHPAEALELAMTAIAALGHATRQRSAEQLSVYGALHLAAATASAAVYDHVQAARLLAMAMGIAGETGDANHLGTAFGPVNVSLHAIAVALRFGDARTAAETGEALDPAALPAACTGRRAQLHLDLARAYAMRRQDAASLNVLLAAEKLSPELVRYDAGTHEILSVLLRREHRPSTPELRPLARRAGVI
jgi:transcriptional regulator with XRE-family HTH domain